MLKNYLRVAFRNMVHNKAFTLINLAGLSLGISAAVIIFLIVQYESGFDKFHPDAASIFRVSGGERPARYAEKALVSGR